MEAGYNNSFYTKDAKEVEKHSTGKRGIKSPAKGTMHNYQNKNKSNEGIRHSKIIQFKEVNKSNNVKDRSAGKTTQIRKPLEYDDRLFITVNSTSRFIKVSNILCITAEKDYTFVCTVDDKKILVLRPMIEWEERLPGKFFARIHRSTIVNLDYVQKVEKWFNYAYHVYLKGMDEPYQMSRRYASKIKERFR